MNRPCVATATVLVLFLTPLHPALASVPGPYDSYVVSSPNGMHVLVMLRPGAADELHAKYPASGCYELGSNVPLWTVNRFFADCYLSNGGRYLVQCNPDADPERGISTSWAIKFYDRGREIRSYDVADLVDYPQLMRWESYGWEWRYWRTEQLSDEIHGELFYVRTSTRERYTFDITTGAIIEEHRFWREVAANAKAALFACGCALVLWYLATRKRRLERAATRCLNQPSASTSRSFRFSIRNLLAFTAICAVLVAVFRDAPHVGVFLTSGLVPVLLMVAIRPSRVVSNRRRRIVRGLILVCWLPCYVLSMGPALAMVEYFAADWDVRMAVIIVGYYPVYWMIYHMPSYASSGLGWYLNLWGA